MDSIRVLEYICRMNQYSRYAKFIENLWRATEFIQIGFSDDTFLDPIKCEYVLFL